MTGPDSRYTEQELRLILQRAVEMERLGPSLDGFRRRARGDRESRRSPYSRNQFRALSVIAGGTSWVPMNSS